MEQIRIVTIDDEKDICILLEKMLSLLGYDVAYATDPQQGIELVKTHAPALVLLDIKMGSVSGLDILPRIKAIDSNIKVILFTALQDEETINKAKILHADGFIPKPFDKDHLFSVLKDTLSRLRKKP